MNRGGFPRVSGSIAVGSLRLGFTTVGEVGGKCLPVAKATDEGAIDAHRVGHTLIADAVPELIKREREALRMGATQIALMAGGGVTSLYDPLDVTVRSFEETKVVVDVARTLSIYVATHLNTEAVIPAHGSQQLSFSG